MSRRNLPALERRRLGERLKNARQKANLTQREAAEKLGLPSPNTLASYEQGDAEIPLAVLRQLPEAYGSTVDIAEVLTGEAERALRSLTIEDMRQDWREFLTGELTNSKLAGFLREAPRLYEEEWEPRYRKLIERAERDIEALARRFQEDVAQLREDVLRLRRAHKPGRERGARRKTD